jgi:hypothetical protein
MISADVVWGPGRCASDTVFHTWWRTAFPLSAMITSCGQRFLLRGQIFCSVSWLLDCGRPPRQRVSESPSETVSIRRDMAEGMISRICSRLFLALAVLSTSIQLVASAAINPAPQVIPTFCTGDPKWAALGVSQQDCLATVDKLYDIEVKPRTKQWEKDDFEFLSPKMPGTPGLKSRSTPRKYTVGQLTLYECCI